MKKLERISAIEAIQQIKARYCRGVDSSDGDLVKSILAEDCVLDYMGCCTDPVSGIDFFPAMNVILRGRDSWTSNGMSGLGIVSVHQSYNLELEFSSDTTAKGIWSMTDRLWFPSGSQFSLMTGYGHYHETYEQVESVWLLKTTRISRIRVETC